MQRSNLSTGPLGPRDREVGEEDDAAPKKSLRDVLCLGRSFSESPRVSVNRRVIKSAGIDLGLTT